MPLHRQPRSGPFLEGSLIEAFVASGPPAPVATVATVRSVLATVTVNGFAANQVAPGFLVRGDCSFTPQVQDDVALDIGVSGGGIPAGTVILVDLNWSGDTFLGGCMALAAEQLGVSDFSVPVVFTLGITSSAQIVDIAANAAALNVELWEVAGGLPATVIAQL